LFASSSIFLCYLLLSYFASLIYFNFVFCLGYELIVTRVKVSNLEIGGTAATQMLTSSEY